MEFVLKDLPLPASLITDVPMSDDELLEFCAKNDLLRVERTRSGEIKLMSPTGSGTGAANAELNRQLGNWAYDNGGVAFDSNTGFSLPDGSMMSPDAAWISDPRWSALSARDRSRFAPLCPEFVIELRSPSDSLPPARTKNGPLDRKRRSASLAHRPRSRKRKGLPPRSRSRSPRAPNLSPGNRPHSHLQTPIRPHLAQRLESSQVSARTKSTF